MSRRIQFRWMLALVVLCLTGPVLGQDYAGQLAAIQAERPASLRISGGAAEWQVKGTFEQAVLTIGGDRGVVHRQEVSGGGPVVYNFTSADGSLLSDGTYAYMLIIRAGAGAPSRRMGGYFSMVNGQPRLVGMDRIIADPPTPSVNPPEQEVFTHTGHVDIEGKLVVGEDSASAASPGDITIVASDESGTDTIRPANLVFINKDDEGTIVDNRTIVSDDAGLRFGPQSVGTISPAQMTIVDGAEENTLVVGVAGSVGIGTAVPVHSLDVVSAAPRLNLSDSDGGSNWKLANIDGDFKIGNNIGCGFLCTTIDPIVTIEDGAPTNSLYIDASGQMGIGTSTPSEDLHVANVDGSGDTVLKLANAAQWNLGSTTIQEFTFNKAGSGGQEFTVRERNHAVATLDVQGHVRGTSFKSTSSRALKTGFEALDQAEVLAKVVEMPVTSWRYKTEEEGTRHFGPVAEDFQRMFGLGDGKSIASVDADGVALAAIQGLNSRLEAKEAEIDDLKQANAGLEARLAKIEALLHP